MSNPGGQHIVTQLTKTERVSHGRDKRIDCVCVLAFDFVVCADWTAGGTLM